jgi:hypothetical protein
LSGIVTDPSADADLSTRSRPNWFGTTWNRLAQLIAPPVPGSGVVSKLKTRPFVLVSLNWARM